MSAMGRLERKIGEGEGDWRGEGVRKGKKREGE